jgi:hypothetical protein
MRYGIGHRHNGFEPEYPIFIGSHNSPSIRRLAVFILYIIKALAVCFPNIYFDARYWFRCGVANGAEDETRLARGIVVQFVSGGDGMRVMGMERT